MIYSMHLDWHSSSITLKRTLRLSSIIIHLKNLITIEFASKATKTDVQTDRNRGLDEAAPAVAAGTETIPDL